MAPTAPLLYSLTPPLAGGEGGLQPTGERGKNNVIQLNLRFSVYLKVKAMAVKVYMHGTLLVNQLLVPIVNGEIVLLLPAQF